MCNQLQKPTNNQLAEMSTPGQHSQKLIACLLKMELEVQKSKAKMEFVQLSRDLMPAGRPAFLEVIKYPKITEMVKEHGSNILLKVLFLMVKDFCNSINVVRNMNEDQMIESASMLLDECDNFRLEDYVMMFSMAKRGDLVKIMDRLDISVLTAMLDEYWRRRKVAGQKATEEPIDQLDGLGSTNKLLDNMHPADAKILKGAEKLTAAMEEIRTRLTDVSSLSKVDEAKKQIFRHLSAMNMVMHQH